MRCRKETESGLEWEVCGEGREGEQGVTLAVCDRTFMARTEHRCGGGEVVTAYIHSICLAKMIAMG